MNNTLDSSGDLVEEEKGYRDGVIRRWDLNKTSTILYENDFS